MIKLDFTQVSTVVTCTLCPGWTVGAGSKLAGWSLGADHQERAHPGMDQAAQALAKARKAKAGGA